MTDIIEVEHLSKRFGATWAVDNVSFTVPQGEILGLLGTNGAGKSTIMRVLTGIFPPSLGIARVAGFDIVKETKAAQARVGYLPETVPIYLEMRVRSFLRYVAEIHGLTGRKRNQATDQVMEEVGLTHVAKRIIGNLSRGYRQRVGIAQAMVSDPEILILDEPTVGLDPAQVIEVRELIRKMKGRRTVILSTHILPEVAATCQKVLIIHQGKLVARGAPHHLQTEFDQPHRCHIKVKGERPSVISAAFSQFPCVRKVSHCELEPDGVCAITLEVQRGAAAEIARQTVQKGWDLLDLRESGDTLEDVFMQAISGEVGE